jgi:hypothetical protein
MERLARDKQSSLLRKSVNYGRKMFYSTGPGTERDGIERETVLAEQDWFSKSRYLPFMNGKW